MKEKSCKNTEKMVYTEEFHIPLGQAVKTPSGDYGLRVKKDKNYEIIPVGKLMAKIIQTVDGTT